MQFLRNIWWLFLDTINDLFHELIKALCAFFPRSILASLIEHQKLCFAYRSRKKNAYGLQ